MNVRTRVLQLSAIFPPALALLVGMSLFLRVRREDEVSRRFMVAENVFNEVLLLNLASHEYLERSSPQAAAEWQIKYESLGRAINRFDLAGTEDQTIPDTMKANYANMAVIFSGLSNEGEDGEDERFSRERAVRDLLTRSQTIISGAFQLTQANHMDAAAVQQNRDALIIVFSSVLAIIMAAGAYMAVKEELTERERVGQELRKSDMRLSDAFLKLRRASEQMIHQEQIHVFEQSVRAIAAETGQVLASLSGEVDQLLGCVGQLGDEGGGLPACAENVRGRIGRLEEALGRLSRMSEPSAFLDRKDVNLNQIVQNALEATRSEWKERPSWALIDVQTDLEDIPLIQGNETDLCEMVTDLIRNAVEALPKGGKLRIRTQSLGKWVGLEFIDDGVGMTPPIEKRCLEPFFSTKGPGHAGMGMTIASGIVGQHHGTIDMETRPGKGTSVAICLPVEFKLGGAADSIDGARFMQGLRVLVVDDEAWSRAPLVHNLMAEGCIVETASAGKEGLEKFRKMKFDLVVTDRAMPDMSGDELAAAIKALDGRMPVVLVSGFGDAADGDGKAYGHVDGVLSKPVRISDFRRMVADAMDLRQPGG